MLGTSIIDITETAFYKKYKSNLCKYHIMFVEQLLNASKSKVLTWPQAIYNNTINRRGPTPKWYPILQNTINNPEKYKLNTTLSKDSNSFLQYLSIMQFYTTQPHWSATNCQGSILIGRKQKNLNNN